MKFHLFLPSPEQHRIFTLMQNLLPYVPTRVLLEVLRGCFSRTHKKVYFHYALPIFYQAPNGHCLRVAPSHPKATVVSYWHFISPRVLLWFPDSSIIRQWQKCSRITMVLESFICIAEMSFIFILSHS